MKLAYLLLRTQSSRHVAMHPFEFERFTRGSTNVHTPRARAPFAGGRVRRPMCRLYARGGGERARSTQDGSIRHSEVCCTQRCRLGRWAQYTVALRAIHRSGRCVDDRRDERLTVTPIPLGRARELLCHSPTRPRTCHRPRSFPILHDACDARD